MKGFDRRARVSGRAYLIWAGLLIVILGCNSIRVVPANQPQTEIPEGAAPPPAPAGEVAPPPTATPVPTATPEPTPTPAPPTPTPFFLQSVSLSPGAEERALPRHGLLIAFVLPVLLIGIPWVIIEFFVVRYVQPRGIDLSSVRIKAQDGMFIEATTSITARRTLTLASTRMSWSRVKNFVEKPLEQELIHEALQYLTLEELERNLKDIAEHFRTLPIMQELLEDFGVQVVRFNIEARYPQETMDALNRRAEASAGGTAYRAYAAAARLNPDSPEARELYRIFQETSGQVDAARNLGGGIASLANMFNREKTPKRVSPDDEPSV